MGGTVAFGVWCAWLCCAVSFVVPLCAGVWRAVGMGLTWLDSVLTLSVIFVVVWSTAMHIVMLRYEIRQSASLNFASIFRLEL